MTFRYYAREDPWQEDDDGPATEAIWNLVGGASTGGEILEPLPEAEMELRREAYKARKAREESATAKP
jgi:hypothetical protein